MILSALSFALLLTPGHIQTSSETFFKDLVRWRTQFEDVLQYPGGYAYYTVGSETLGGAHGDAFYPIGSASERYMLSFNADVLLIYQKRRGNKAVVVWQLPLTKSSSKSAVTGTMPKYLQRLGYRISSRTRMTSAIRKQLAKTGHFATYSYHHMQGGYASVIRPDGTSMEVHRSEDVFVCTPEEKDLLRTRKR